MSSCDDSVQGRGPRTRSPQQAETVDQPTSETSKAECASRPRLKRKHEESSSMQPPCQVLHSQVMSPYIWYTRNQLPQDFSTVQHEDLSLCDKVKDEVSDEPSDTTTAIKKEHSPVTKTNQEFLDVTKYECDVKQECEETQCEMLLFDNPDPDCLDSDDVPESSVNPIPESSVETFPESSSTVNVSIPNEYIKFIDVQDIFKRSTDEKVPKDSFRMKNVMSLNPQNIFVDVDTEYKKCPASSPNQEKLKNSFFIRCIQCKQYLCNETSAKSHKCTGPPKLVSWARNCISEDGLNHCTLNPQKVVPNQNAVLNQSSTKPFMLYFDPHIQDFNKRKIAPKPNSVGISKEPSQQFTQKTVIQSSPNSQPLFQQPFLIPTTSVTQEMVSVTKQPVLIPAPRVAQNIVSQSKSHQPFLIPTTVTQSVSSQPFSISLPSASSSEPQRVKTLPQPSKNPESNFVKIAPKPVKVTSSPLYPLFSQIEPKNQPRTFAKPPINNCYSFPTAAHEIFYGHISASIILNSNVNKS